MSNTVLYTVIATVALLFLSAAFVMRRLVRCPPDKVLVVYGKVVGQPGAFARCYHGGAVFIWPLIQDYAFLDLEPRIIEIEPEPESPSHGARSGGRFVVGISTQPGVVEKAAERFLGGSPVTVSETARGILVEELRLAAQAGATVEARTEGEPRDAAEALVGRIETELSKMGLCLINVELRSGTGSAASAPPAATAPPDDLADFKPPPPPDNQREG